jgi:YD repeat-containing protein
VQGSATYTYNYEYDKENHLTKYYRDNIISYNIGTNQVDQVVTDYIFYQGATVPFSTSGYSFVYTLVGQPNTSVNLYTTAPTQVTYTYYYKNDISGETTSKPGGQLQFYNNKDGLPTKIITSDGGGKNTNLTYDDNGNLKLIEFVNLSGPRVGAVYGRLTVKSLDDKSSPFSGVKGYPTISYPQGYPQDYALAYCKNNPKQIISESYDVSKNAFVVYQQDDFTYTYNDKGYPTQIVVNTTYINAVTTHNTRTYNYTYK